MMSSILSIFAVALAIDCAPTLNSTSPSSIYMINPETIAEYVEGDMILPVEKQLGSLNRGVPIFGKQYRWINNTIPFSLANVTDVEDRRKIFQAMNHLMETFSYKNNTDGSKQLCLLFRPALPSDEHILYFRYGTGCSATVGLQKYWPNTVNLMPVGCFQPGTIYHEILHSLGFFHEQARPDRDSYITIKFENIPEDKKHNFEKYAWNSDVENQDFPYDYESIMHYGEKYFSLNGESTIIPKNPGAVIGNRLKLSKIDIAEVRRYYGCPGSELD